MSSSASNKPSFSPKHWPGWIGISLLWVLGKLPKGLGLLLIKPMGPLMYALMGRRRRIADINLARCFPELDEQQRKDLLRKNFKALARTLVEIAWAWSAPERTIRKLGQVEGLEHIEVVKDKGILLVTAHMSCLEIGGRILSLHTRLAGIYRPLKSPVLEWYQNRGRGRYTDMMITKKDSRGSIRRLRSGEVLWYAPDQDFGLSQSEFAPFFGIQTATLLATHRLAKMTGCAVIPMFPIYNQDSKDYTVHILPALEDFPSDDPAADLGRINAAMEAHIRKAPEQYWWIHRRFKTRPEGEPPFYESL